ncbi:chaperone protein EcpD [Oxalobacteraceae bacterium GrIS 2.11]
MAYFLAIYLPETQNKMSDYFKRIFLFVALTITMTATMTATTTAHANIVINGTRVIYNAEENEATIRLTNVSSTPSLVQVWLDSGDMQSTPETGKSPFIATPPIFRVEPNRAQTVRVIYTHDPLPQDKESVFWVNILDVPPMPVTKDAEDANYMQLAIRSRIKLFYRPKGLPGSAVEAADKLSWQLIQKPDSVVLRASNDAVFSVSMDAASISNADKNYSIVTEMIPPASSKEFLVKELKKIPSGSSQINYTTISDFGSVVQHNTSLPP